MATTPTGTGTQAGAEGVLGTFTTGGKLPASWYSRAQTIVSGPYAIVTTAGGGGLDSLGNISWKDSSGKTQQLYFTVGSDGTITASPSTTNPDAVSTFQKFLNSLTPVGTTSPNELNNLTTAGNDIKNVTSWAASLGKILSEVSTSAFWKRVGIGFGGVLLFIIGIVLLMRRDIPSPADIIRKA